METSKTSVPLFKTRTRLSACTIDPVSSSRTPRTVKVTATKVEDRWRAAYERAGSGALQALQVLVAAEDAAGRDTHPIDYDFVPAVTFCHPQVASMGLTEQQAKDAGHEVKVASFPFTANGKAMGLGDAVGFVKVVADAEHNEIVGAHLIGPEVTELLPVLTLAQQWDLTADEVARNVFAHPTLTEVLGQFGFQGGFQHVLRQLVQPPAGPDRTHSLLHRLSQQVLGEFLLNIDLSGHRLDHRA